MDAPSLSASIGRVISSLDYDLVLCGDRSQDEGRGCVPAFLADYLGCSQVTKVIKLEVSPDRKLVNVWRKLERGWREEIECQLPAVMGIERTALEPRYMSVFSVKASYNRPLTRVEAEIGEGRKRFLQIVELIPPRPRTKKIFVPDASLSPEERFQLLLSGGAAPKKSSDYVEGTSEQVAKEVVNFLSEQGFLLK
jgi:electron transfer flavoprotein beta subunit